MPVLRHPRLFATAITTVLAIAVGSAAFGQASVTPNLTDKLDRLLRQEMRSVQSAMGRIHTAIVTGDHESVRQNAQRIHDSFILKRSLTSQDRKDLKAAVPPGFIKLDREFHDISADLARAGQRRDTAKELHVYERMTRNCVQCHDRYASGRFPDVRAPSGDQSSASSR
ncbi:hypothetical protein KBTX_03971 [wastewater metagenome]|uniref:Cytochrome C n=2 Tax=unclassified sequences TaxID=12908 RepID=A0A5B8RIR9_9ZZZZ|nr:MULTISPECIES: hypothetical protein [Arhodomonas]MCS4503552.1 hypothetical protein [Arhodomonas aquaeolei]QEA07612.1 hypothetical protein KBTEX_03971 [uncultured organism]